jgi:biotin operon repressor
MSMAALRVIRPICVPPTQKVILWALADQADDDGVSWPSIASLIEATCLSERAIQSAISALRQAGILSTEAGGGRHRTTKYRIITPQVVRGYEDEEVGETPQMVRGNDGETPHLLHETPQEVRETPQELHPNPQEPSLTLIERKKRARASAPALDIPTWLPADAWAEWSAYRLKRSGRGWTDHAAALAVRELGKLNAEGHSPRAVIEQSIASGWTGLFPLKAQAQQSRQPANVGLRAAALANFQTSRPAFDVEGFAEELPQ